MIVSTDIQNRIKAWKYSFFEKLWAGNLINETYTDFIAQILQSFNYRLPIRRWESRIWYFAEYLSSPKQILMNNDVDRSAGNKNVAPLAVAQWEEKISVILEMSESFGTYSNHQKCGHACSSADWRKRILQAISHSGGTINWARTVPVVLISEEKLCWD